MCCLVSWRLCYHHGRQPATVCPHELSPPTSLVCILPVYLPTSLVSSLCIPTKYLHPLRLACTILPVYLPTSLVSSLCIPTKYLHPLRLACTILPVYLPTSLVSSLCIPTKYLHPPRLACTILPVYLPTSIVSSLGFESSTYFVFFAALSSNLSDQFGCSGEHERHLWWPRW